MAAISHSHKNRMELVSPAGGWEQLVAAINGGADAVYAGLKKFSARAYAGNFELPQMKRAVKTAHENGVKVFLALNTLIKDIEFKEITNLLNAYLDICQDGVIIQDLGFYEVINDLFPGIRVHASTQLSIHNKRSVEFLKDVGICRTVLAREMTLKEICAAGEENTMELEVFVHGSQCYSYSGKCFFSSFTGSRSGNRGRCTQPCRMKYGIVSGTDPLIEDAYLLSKSDLCTLELIPELAESGINALKIEGRMKSPEYVGIVTSIYRKYIDLYQKDPENFFIDERDVYKITQIFSRETGTGYFLKNLPEDIISLKRSGSVGNFLGRIIRIEKDSVFLKSKWRLNKDDLIEFWTNRGNIQLRLKNFNIIEEDKGKVSYRIDTPGDFRASIGDRVFKSFDSSLDKEAKGLFIKGINVKEENLKIKGPRTVSVAIKEKQLNADEIAEYYRDYDDLIDRSKTSSAIKKIVNRSQVKAGLILEVYNMAHASSIGGATVKTIVLNNFQQTFLDLKNNISNLKELLKKCRADGVELVIKTPDIIYDSDFKKLEEGCLELCDSGFYNYSVSNLGVLNYLSLMSGSISRHALKKPLHIFLDHGINIFNSKAILFFNRIIGKNKNMILKDVVLSAELCVSEIKNIIDLAWQNKTDNISKSVYSYGYYPVMAARININDLIKVKKDIYTKEDLYLTDRKKYRFKIISDHNKNAVFLNSKKICNFFDLPDIIDSGINNIYIDTRTFTQKEIEIIIQVYEKGINYISKGMGKELEKITTRASKNNLFSDYTRGHLYRGVI